MQPQKIPISARIPGGLLHPMGIRKSGTVFLLAQPEEGRRGGHCIESGAGENAPKIGLFAPKIPLSGGILRMASGSAGPTTPAVCGFTILLGLQMPRKSRLLAPKFAISGD